MTVIITWLLPISLVAYIATFNAIISRIKKEQAQFWVDIGSPSIFDPNGQMKILSTLIFGIGCPERISEIYQVHLSWVRFLLILNLACFLLLIYLMANGAFDG
ncbi:hypothetical protein [Endozoicomonas acroporae]|uniref:hypothetical protein n=1 Tax=Endozoicomonas acroporae TaxID=1701104 RepID=UPI003D7B4856